MFLVYLTSFKTEETKIRVTGKMHNVHRDTHCQLVQCPGLDLLEAMPRSPQTYKKLRLQEKQSLEFTLG